MNLFKYLFGKGDPDDPMKGSVSDKTRARQRPPSKPWESAGHGKTGHNTSTEDESLQSVKRRNSVAKWLLGLVIFGAVGSLVFSIIMEETGGTGYYEEATDDGSAPVPSAEDMVVHNCFGFTVDTSVPDATRCYAYIRTYSPDSDAVYAVDAAGNTQWKYTLADVPSYGNARMQVSGDYLLVMSKTQLWVLDKAKGRLLWEKKLPNPVTTSETYEPMWVVGDTWLVLDEQKLFTAFSVSTGQPRWTYQASASYYPAFFHVPLLPDAFAILDIDGNSADCAFRVLNARTGRLMRTPKPGVRYGSDNQYMRTPWSTSRVQQHPNGKHRFVFYTNIGGSAPAVIQQLDAGLTTTQATYALPAQATQTFGATRYPWLMTPDWAFVETGSQVASADRFLVALNLQTRQSEPLFTDPGYQYKALAFEQNMLVAYAYHNTNQTSQLMGIRYTPATKSWKMVWKHDLNGAVLVKDGNLTGETFGYWVDGASIGILSSDKRLTILNLADGSVGSTLEMGGPVSMLKYMAPPVRFGSQVLVSVSGLQRLVVRSGSAYLEPLVKDFRAK